MEFVTNNLMYVVLAAVSGGMLLWQTVKGVGGNQLSPQAATLLMNRAGAVVIDVSSSAEWSAGHIPEARHIPLDQFDKHLPELEKHKSKPLIVSCQSGVRSGGACGKLKKQGFEQVYNLAGGMAAWREAGLPVTTK
ncbi:MAG: rhodanese-like domain-containing protein [Sterolibacterium sp.]|nr:rhodanese-like domain-containing protein [Sterolibacterium sp.]